MALVNYSCSSSDSEEEPVRHTPQTFKRLKLESPKFLSPSHENHQIKENILDEKHEGRIRSFEHERGNWATFIYIPVILQTVEDLQDSLKNSLKSDLNLKPSVDIHISLTKTVVLQHHWIESFCKSVRLELTGIREFQVAFGSISIYCNEEKTRTFIGVTVDSIFNQSLIPIVNKLDKVLEEYRLDTFYNNPSFHASILWCVGDHREYLQTKLSVMEKLFKEYLSHDPEDFEVKITKVICKTGNKYFSFHLK